MRASAALIAQLARKWGIPVGREHIVGHHEIYALKTCPGAQCGPGCTGSARRGALDARGALGPYLGFDQFQAFQAGVAPQEAFL